ncbi:MAG: chorismate mutase [Anaerolineae bacterium]|nr:chorismate mutase [Anaerolineae bacterium]MDK1080442.1 chorismate mutase [Anaerolineae bacterium]
MTTRGIRGAITIEIDQEETVLSSTSELLETVQALNPSLKVKDIISILFTITDDIISAYPALAARQMGWDSTPMLCVREMNVKDGLPLCIRVLIHWNTDLDQSAIQHVYLREAIKLRPDLASRA